MWANAHIYRCPIYRSVGAPGRRDRYLRLAFFLAGFFFFADVFAGLLAFFALRAGGFFSINTAPATGSVTPRPPPRSSSVSRKLSRMPIILGRAATILSKDAHSAITQ